MRLIKGKLNFFVDPDGQLTVCELNRIGFRAKRLFWVTHSSSARGGHAHKETEQVIFCVRGKIKVSLISDRENTIELYENEYLYIGSRAWDSYQFFPSDSIVFVAANTEYDKNDYINTKEEFEQCY